MSDRKRASLRGKGWKIFFGTEPPDDLQPEQERPPGHMDLTDDEAEDLLAGVPGPLGMMEVQAQPVAVQPELPDENDFLEARRLEAEPEPDLPEIEAPDLVLNAIEEHPEDSLVGQLGTTELGPEETGPAIYDVDKRTGEGLPLLESALKIASGLDLTNATIVPRKAARAVIPEAPEFLDEPDRVPATAPEIDEDDQIGEAETEADEGSGILSGAASIARSALTRLGASQATETPDYASHKVDENELELQKAQGMIRRMLRSEGEMLIQSSRDDDDDNDDYDYEMDMNFIVPPE